jgi:hypothetical protein
VAPNVAWFRNVKACALLTAVADCGPGDSGVAGGALAAGAASLDPELPSHPASSKVANATAAAQSGRLRTNRTLRRDLFTLL